MKPFIFLSFLVFGTLHVGAQELNVPKVENQPEERLGIPQTNRNLLLEDEDTKIWVTTLLPHSPLKAHRHDRQRIVVPLTDTNLKKIFADTDGKEDPSKAPVMLEWKRGHAYRFDADPKGELHGDLNESDKPMKVLVIEFKTPVPEIEKKKADAPEEPKHKYGTHD